jgi:hypothetical protein
MRVSEEFDVAGCASSRPHPSQSSAVARSFPAGEQCKAYSRHVDNIQSPLSFVALASISQNVSYGIQSRLSFNCAGRDYL